MNSGDRARIKDGWQGAGRKATVIQILKNGCWADLGQDWVALKWDDSDDPDVHKLSGLDLLPLEDRRWPRPWTQDVFIIEDATAKEVLHLGALGSKMKSEELNALAALIVAAVNKFAVEAE